MSLCAAYIITHIASGKKYVGSTNNFNERKLSHLSALRNNRHKNENLQKAYNEDAEIHFEVYMAEDREEAFAFEQFMLDEFFHTGLLFNLHEFAQLKGHKLSEDIIKKMSLGSMGKFHAEQTKRKISLALEGNNNNPNGWPKGQKQKRSKAVSIDGIVYSGILEASQKLGISYITISNRVRSESDTYKDWTWA